ncbi:hypothetical protein TTHERM_00188750 (macronuclear) [Tetrahymena thermophila SB210]|uniref:Uncharacterized protein n=1 Tax=Tetrahymena thermophila (strain SB210) TaxID=312017 RepID=I7M1G5_TETTS|nr:hypothetical protein TTHERM_00188750 [Tetrahymena thermophila SB210]EAR96306.1 hypothetical protein TTHERM_00188750 [Tetrahymena thermophila SB210]|eukprot:XP_001016551.1 hypothetical protein TTHERM_00188750 [Tetrahymena thermophila SB210]
MTRQKGTKDKTTRQDKRVFDEGRDSMKNDTIKTDLEKKHKLDLSANGIIKYCIFLKKRI